MSGLAELIERMLKEEFICYSPIVGGGEINVEDFAFGLYNAENALFLTAEEFGRKHYRVNWVGEHHTEIACIDDDIDVEYQRLIVSFETSLVDKEKK